MWEEEMYPFGLPSGPCLLYDTSGARATILRCQDFYDTDYYGFEVSGDFKFCLSGNPADALAELTDRKQERLANAA